MEDIEDNVDMRDSIAASGCTAVFLGIIVVCVLIIATFLIFS